MIDSCKFTELLSYFTHLGQRDVMKKCDLLLDSNSSIIYIFEKQIGKEPHVLPHDLVLHWTKTTQGSLNIQLTVRSPNSLKKMNVNCN